MKRKLFCGILVALFLCLGPTLPAWAYKVTFTSELASTDGVVYGRVWYAGYDYNIGYGHGLSPGKSATFDNSDWKTAGLCWDKVEVKPKTHWKDCAAPEWKSMSISKCSDMTVTFKRAGCDINITIE